ncbi:WRKY transcription factor 22-like [Arachis duranensis]|uniref:WRKY transcription factor 22-like n=1 Tax=Arachis duranensis TaxID=130453 RepID=A0A6P4C8L2_ARADU|nr:WRKY transcription factor 22-like [Arachis duranensis]
MDDDWDLHAVVRGCATISSTSSTTTTTTSTTTTSYQPPPSSSCGFFNEQQSNVFSVSNNNPFELRSSIQELQHNHNLCKPFFFKSQPFQSFQSSSSSSSPPNSALTQHKQQQQNCNNGKNPHHAGSATTPRSKRRKNQLKNVCQVSAENLSSDVWAWRKYGQKPIKGSPYPRGYYRCSSSKGCLARKQVERDRSDPTKFIVTFTGVHNHPAPTHRNSLAGSSRQKLQTPEIATTGDTEMVLTMKPVSILASPSTSGVEEEAETEATPAQKSESEEDNMEDYLMNDDDGGFEETEFGSPDMEITDDFFEGLDELTTATDGDSCFSTSVPNPSLPPFVANSAATAAGGS